MHKLMLMGVIIASLATFGTGFAQNTAQPAEGRPTSGAGWPILEAYSSNAH